MIKLGPLSTKHFDDVVSLISKRYSELHTYAPLLPDRYVEYDVITPLLESIIDNAPGVVAYEDGRLAGFIGGWILSEFRGQRAVLSPEWGNATQLDNSCRIYEAMYGYISREWLRHDCYTHLMCQYADRPADISAWNWLGFGMAAADGVRDLQPLKLNNKPYRIKRAEMDDLEQVHSLVKALAAHISASPTFLFDEENVCKEDTGKLLADSKQVVWLAFDQHKAVGFLRHGPASDYASTIIRDPGTTSIRGLYTIPAARGRGIAADLLNQALSWSKQQDYERCCVDFEPMNTLAARFWPRHFKIVSFAMLRTIDARIAIDA